MVLRLGNANHIEVLALRIVQLRIAKVRVGFEPRTRFEKAANVWVFEDAAVLAEDDAANQFQIVDFRSTYAKPVETTPGDRCAGERAGHHLCFKGLRGGTVA